MDSLDKKKRKFRSLLPEEGIIGTIASLKKFVHEESGKFKILVLIESQFKEIRRKEQQGILAYETIQLEESKTRKKLLDFIDDLEWNDIVLYAQKDESNTPKIEYKSVSQNQNLLIDNRDGQIYETVQLLGSTWMAENLNFDVGEGCYFYNNNPGNANKFGRLYTLEAAKKSCPLGWRLPLIEEIEMIIDHFKGKEGAYKALIDGGSSGFNARLGGRRYANGGFSNVGINGSYWTASFNNTSNAWNYEFHNKIGRVHRYVGHYASGFSVRCVKDL